MTKALWVHSKVLPVDGVFLLPHHRTIKQKTNQNGLTEWQEHCESTSKYICGWSILPASS